MALQCKQTLKGHTGGVLCSAFNSDGTYCVSGSQDRTIRLWNVNTAAEIQVYRGMTCNHRYLSLGHSADVMGVDVRQDNSAIASCGERTVYLWDVLQGKFIRKFFGHVSRVNCVTFGPPGDDTVLISGSDDSTVRVWDLRAHSRDPIQIFNDAKDSISSVIATNHEIIASSIDGYSRTYDLRQGKCIQDYSGHSISCASLSHDEQCLLVCHPKDNGKLLLFDRGGGELLSTYRGHVNNKYRVGCAFSSDDAYVYCGSEDGMVYAYDLVDAKVSYVLRGHAGVVTDVVVFKEKLISCGNDGTVRVWGP